jgi:hypothetical protein
VPHVRHEATENVSIGKLTDVDLVTEAAAESDVLQLVSGLWVPKALSELGLTLSDNDDVVITTAANGQVLEYDSVSSDWLNVDPWDTDRRVSSFLAGDVQAGPVNEWTPLGFTDDSLANGHGDVTLPTATTNIIGSWTPVALPTTHLDVDDASGFTTPAANKNTYISVDIPGSAVTVIRYTGISIGGGAGGSDRITLQAAGHVTGLGHRGVGTPAAAAEVREVQVEIFSDGGGTLMVLLVTGQIEAISSGIVSWRIRSALPFFGWAQVAGVSNSSTNTAEESAQVASISAVGAEGSGAFNGGVVVEFRSSVAGGTAGQVRSDPSTLGPALQVADFGEGIIS